MSCIEETGLTLREFAEGFKAAEKMPNFGETYLFPVFLSKEHGVLPPFCAKEAFSLNEPEDPTARRIAAIKRLREADKL